MNKPDIGRVVLWMSGALLSFSLMAVSIRELGGLLNVFEILSIRSASGVLILLMLATWRPQLCSQLFSGRVGLHTLRNFVNFGGQVSWAQGLTLLPFATVFALEFTTPMWVALLAVIFLGERLSVSRAGTVVFGFLGVLVIVRPGLESFQPAALLVLGSALCFATTSIVTKKLIATESTFTILFYMNLIQLPLNLAGSNILFPAKLGWAHALPVLGVVISGLSSHFCLTNAFRHGDAIIVMPLDFLRIPLIAIIAWAFYGERLDVIVFLGAGLIIAGIVWNLVDEARRRAPPQ
ncbi:MAG TPA: DMT family transporter [Xanthobacteraceae bacterium]|nr:DMT family transporter [Xanthobacteraceae bacterium]